MRRCHSYYAPIWTPDEIWILWREQWKEKTTADCVQELMDWWGPIKIKIIHLIEAGASFPDASLIHDKWFEELAHEQLQKGGQFFVQFLELIPFNKLGQVSDFQQPHAQCKYCNYEINAAVGNQQSDDFYDSDVTY
ncbi:16616_t:CDS:2 [Entrophospora sp. SA101]|nr:16616_t:CDS:2 [Entrophospora sp. SA101]